MPTKQDAMMKEFTTDTLRETYEGYEKFCRLLSDEANKLMNAHSTEPLLDVLLEEREIAIETLYSLKGVLENRGEKVEDKLTGKPPHASKMPKKKEEKEVEKPEVPKDELPF